MNEEREIKGIFGINIMYLFLILFVGLSIVSVALLFINSEVNDIKEQLVLMRDFDNQVTNYSERISNSINKLSEETWKIRGDLADSFLNYNNISLNETQSLLGCVEVQSNNLMVTTNSVLIAAYPNGLLYFYENKSLSCVDYADKNINCSNFCNVNKTFYVRG